MSVNAGNKTFATTEYVAETGILTLDTASLAGVWGDVELEITTSASIVTANALVYRSISTADEFANIKSYTTLEGTAGTAGSKRHGYFVLTSDIDATGVNINLGGWFDGWGEIFNGTFDGQNHVIYNFTENDGNGGIFSSTTGTTVIKNVRFYNASVGGMCGIISTSWYGLIENVFISGKITGGGQQWANTGLIISKSGPDATLSFKNVAAVLEDNKITDTSLYAGIVVGEGSASMTFENVITIQIAGTKTGNYNVGKVTLANTVNNESATVKAFGSAEEYLTWFNGDGATTAPKALISNYVGTNIQPTANSNVITAGNTVSVACAQPSWVANWAISPTVAVVSVSNAGVVTVANTVSAGTTFDVVTTGVDGTTRSMSFIVCEFVNLTVATQYIDLSNSETNTVINLTDKVEGEFVSAKVAGNTAVANASGAVVTIGADQFAFGNNTVVLRFEKKSGANVIKVTEVTVTVKKADLVISDTASFNKINAVYTAKGDAVVFVKNSFVYEGTYTGASVSMNGKIYGDGNSIYNLTVNNAIFKNTGLWASNLAEIRDIAFVNVTITKTKTPLLSASVLGTFRNLYISLSAQCASNVYAISSASGGAKRIHDVFVDMTAANNAYTISEYHLNYGMLNGVYAVGATALWDNKTANVGATPDVGVAYADRTAMKVATDWQAEFATWDKNFWTTDSDGLSIPKSVVSAN